MLNPRRLIVAVAFGFVMGIMCYVGAMVSFGKTFDTPQVINIFLNRMLIGFVIGISVLKISWYLHGLLIGFIVGLPFLMTVIILGNTLPIIAAVFILNPIFGFTIEFFTSKVFKLNAT